MTPSDSDGRSRLPPSAKYVYYALREREDQQVTRQELQEAVDLPESTLDRAIDRLQNEDYIAKTRDSGDLREVVLIMSTTRTDNIRTL